MKPKRNTGNQRFECPVLRKLHTGYYRFLCQIGNQSVNYFHDHMKDAECLLKTGEIAQKIAYEATRNHVEKYSPQCRTGLITNSIPALEEVLVFWRGESGQYGM